MLPQVGSATMPGMFSGLPSNTLSSQSTQSTTQQFLQMLADQVQNQNPLSPMTSTDLMTQFSDMTQATGVAQLTSLLTVEIETQQALAGVQLLGQQVTAQFNNASVSGVVTGVKSAPNSPPGLTISTASGTVTVPLTAVSEVTKG